MSDPAQVKADLIPYTAEYARDVRSWIDSPETLQVVCRSTKFPPADDIVDSWQRPGVSSYILLSGNKPIAYAELWSRPLELAIEIVHLIVAPMKRTQGYGTKMLTLLYQRAAQRKDIAKVLLNLNVADEVALGCYLKAGFELVGVSQISAGLRMVRMVR